ncbi:MAG: lysophospholipid acyltransferase family protein [Acidimicrobiales bacterium]
MSTSASAVARGPAASTRVMTWRALAFYAVCRAIAVGVSRLWYPGTVTGRENLPRSGSYILAPVHRSNVDWLVVARVTRRRLRYLVKGEVWRVKSVGRLLELLGTFPVHRGTADREALARAAEVLASGEPLVMFPEGTRGSGPVVGELRAGAAYLALRAGVPVVPVGVSGLERSMPRGAKFPRPVFVRVVVGAPIPPREAAVDQRGRQRVSRASIDAMSDEVRAGIQAAFSEAEAPSRWHHRGPAVGP